MTEKKKAVKRPSSKASAMHNKGLAASFAKLKRIKGVQIAAKAAIYFLLICIGYVYLAPIFEMVSKAVMSAEDLVDPSITWLAKTFTLENFKAAIDTLDLGTSLPNSIWFSALLALAQTAVSATTGFALSRYKFKGRGIWFGMIILAFILPVPLLTVPRIMLVDTFRAMTGINLMGTVVPQFLMALLGQGTYSTILVLVFYNFFNMIPTSLDEAAMIDGASAVKVFYHVAIRLSASTILVVFMLSFVFNWNESYTTSTMLRDGLELLPIKLSLFDNEAATGDASAVNEAYKMAATLISIAPLLLLYSLVQRQFIEGIENAGITGE